MIQFKSHLSSYLLLALGSAGCFPWWWLGWTWTLTRTMSKVMRGRQRWTASLCMHPHGLHPHRVMDLPRSALVSNTHPLSIGNTPVSTGPSVTILPADSIPDIAFELWYTLAKDCIICLVFWTAYCCALIACYLSWIDLMLYQQNLWCHCLLTAYWLLTDCLLIAYWLLTDCLLIKTKNAPLIIDT
jgi:hypothetical protein